MRLVRGTQDKYWKAELKGSTLSILSGDTGTRGQAETKTFPTPYEAVEALTDQEIEKGRRGYSQISPEQLDALLKPESGRTGADSPAPERTDADSRLEAIRGSYPTTPVKERPLPTTKPPEFVREGAYAQTFTGPNVHIPKLRAATGSTRMEDPPRATSGGRPILAEGQKWPVCGYCDGRPLGLYLQFDVEERFMLSIPTGSHFLLFHCTHCNTVPATPNDLRLPESWLADAHESSYRIIVNPPGAREIAHPADPIMNEQHVTFTAGKEKVTTTADGFVGKRKFKIGGVPHWIQPPKYPTCACGKPMGFVLQVPTTEQPGWATSTDSSPPFAGGLDAFIFACTVQSHPLATIMIIQR